MAYKNLRLVLGDQLSRDIASLQDINQNQDVVFMCENWQEATYVRHHKKKLAFLFSAMRHFAKELEEKGFHVDYQKLDVHDTSSSFTTQVKNAITRHRPEKLIVTFPGEYRVLQEMKKWEEEFNLPVEIREDDRFLCTREEFSDWAKGKKVLRMEYFYREMRKKSHILMDGDQPAGGKWNYDSDNREPPPANLNIPKPYQPVPDTITQEVLELVEKKFPDHFGDLEPFHFAVTRQEALKALNDFIDRRLSDFGSYQDAMKEEEPFMFHALLSMYLNCGLLQPTEVIEKAETKYRKNNIPINAAEGFIRQILGWREFIRGIYWQYMPDYEQMNELNAQRPLPDFYWHPDQTKMNCLRQCITETKKNAYAHHIQRLMVTGNFALIAGIHPDEINEWYLIVYADAYQWVELPNVSGMILYADGGILASKPYAAGGAYINRMSDYCQNCSYNVKEKSGEKACPFNYLYWNFLMEHEQALQNNPRIALAYNNLRKFSEERKQAIREDSQRFFEEIGIA